MELMKLCYVSDDGKRRVSFCDTSTLNNENKLNSAVEILKHNFKGNDVTSVIELKNGTNFSDLMILKFEYKEGKLFIYDYLYSVENREKIEITKINGISIKEIIERIKNAFGEDITDNNISIIFSYPEALKELGIFDGNYIITTRTLADKPLAVNNEYEENNINLTNLNTPLNRKKFFKMHEKSKLITNIHRIDELNLVPSKGSNKLNYAFDSSTKILKLLSEISQSSFDKRLFFDCSVSFTDNEALNTEDTNLDWMIISSFFLLNEKNKKSMPDDYNNHFEKYFSEGYMRYSYFLDSNNDPTCNLIQEDLQPHEIASNTHIIVDNKLDYSKLFTSIRNALAHSSYEVLDDERIRVFGLDPNTGYLNFNVIITKTFVKKLIEDIITFGSMENLFPLMMPDSKRDKDCTYRYDADGVNSKEELVQLINSRSFFNITNIKFKENVKDLLVFFSLGINPLKRYCKDGFVLFDNSNMIADYLNHYMSKVLEYDVTEEKLSDVDTQNIIEEIEEKYKEFYSLSLYNQMIILSNIYKNKVNGNQNLLNAFFKLINTKEKNSGSLVNTLNSTATEIYDLENYYKVLIIAFLNNTLLYSYNENTQIDTSGMNLTGSMNIDKDKLIKAKNETIKQLENYIKNLKEEKGNLEKAIQKQEATVNSEAFQTKIPPKVKADIIAKLANNRALLSAFDDEKQEEKIRIAEEKKELHVNLLSDMLSNNFDMDLTILRHFRNSLAHGNIRFPKKLDIYDIASLELEFEDIDPKTNEQTFKGTIKLEVLLKELSNRKFIDSIYKNNSHLNR